MSWIYQNKRTWRTVVLLLAAVALVGPWAFERLHVPAQYACSLRLEGDFCGSPLPGILVFFMIIGGIIELVRALTLTEIDRALQILSVLIAATFTLLPLFTTLILIIGQGSRSKLQAITWSVAAGAGPFLALNTMSTPHPAAWGIWLYIAVTVGALLLELLAFVADKQPDLSRAPER